MTSALMLSRDVLVVQWLGVGLVNMSAVVGFICGKQ